MKSGSIEFFDNISAIYESIPPYNNFWLAF